MKLSRLTALGEIKDGKMTLKAPELFRTLIAKYDDSKIRIIVERQKKSKSKEQLGYYWGVVLPHIARDTGHSVDELHQIFKARFLEQKMIWRGGDIRTVRSTSELDTSEMAEFITEIIAEAGTLGISIPEPDQTYDL